MAVPRHVASADDEFDELIPAEIRHLSRTHWTPVEVAIRAATLLCPAPNMTILDVGSGVGKLCTVGALSSPAKWCGVERHEMLVTAARRLAKLLGAAESTMFVHGDAFSLDWSQFDALYFYNPFELDEPDANGRHDVDPRGQIAQVEERLAGLREGTRVVTLHGFGGAMPASYRLAYHERIPTIGVDLVLWIQRGRTGRTGTLS